MQTKMQKKPQIDGVQELTFEDLGFASCGQQLPAWSMVQTKYPSLTNQMLQDIGKALEFLDLNDIAKNSGMAAVGSSVSAAITKAILKNKVSARYLAAGVAAAVGGTAAATTFGQFWDEYLNGGGGGGNTREGIVTIDVVSN